MNVLMLAEYFPPYDFGGAEWSTYYLADGLGKQKIDITVYTPNYVNTKSKERNKNFRVERFPWYKKVNRKKQLSPYWQSNLLWVFWTTIFTIKFCLKNPVDIIHVQGKYFLPAAIISKLILRKKMVITLRDYIILCPLGMCLMRGSKACNTVDYFKKDFPQYRKVYSVEKNLFKNALLFIFIIRARFISIFLKLLLNFADSKVAISEVVKNIYNQSMVREIEVIYNPMISSKESSRRNESVVYCGRLTPGKGVDLLLEVIPNILKNFPQCQFLFYGQGFLKKYLIERSKLLGISGNVKFFGQTPHFQVIKALASAKLVVIPSVWSEPLSRTGIESISLGTPTVISYKSGNKEFFKDQNWGKIVHPGTQELERGIYFSLVNNERIIKSIRKDYFLIRDFFSTKVFNDYQRLYYKLLK